MDRRLALKNMGLSLGYAVAMPSLISIVQSCKNDKVLEWTPDFFTKEQGSVLTHLVDIIIPKTDTPSASEVQVHLFIDRLTDRVTEKDKQDFMKMSMNKFIEKALKDSGKDNASDLGPEDLEPVLAESLKKTKEDQIENFKAIDQYTESMANGEQADPTDEISRFGFANNLRGLTIWGYKTSEYVGETVLAYLPVPGEYIGCGDLNELTGGKAWSL
ncbi:gluconate 2-dehydrogenase subunit 3 family protein [Flavobacteriaceae bacterium F89]|uniref:Gluconate 2-dehydrogenase subunit 3 family protein n=1 Tax=Cerina litoralis TaxID=2874477 RepID=A0AAE3ET86_9FLAO|nr:gluconate 2-dehydrogenase subunit 3 family protein [Cerina litoralis]MCG2459142.1 gluconate 2-dehydrogenase subunit 3 family protein [Cerina litoralis]